MAVFQATEKWSLLLVVAVLMQPPLVDAFQFPTKNKRIASKMAEMQKVIYF